MAEGLNRVMLLGNLGADPELRMTSGGQAVLKLRLATSETYLDKNRQRQERTEWHNVVIWGKRAEALAKILTKGTRIFVEGGLRTSSYEDRDGTSATAPRWCRRTSCCRAAVVVAGRVAVAAAAAAPEMPLPTTPISPRAFASSPGRPRGVTSRTRTTTTFRSEPPRGQGRAPRRTRSSTVQLPLESRSHA